MRLCRPVCDWGSRCKNRKRGTECGAALDREGKHATTCPCGHALSARHDALRDENAKIARHTCLSAVDHPAIDPEYGARMDVRVSKAGVQNSGELIAHPRFALKPLDLWANPLPSPKARNARNTDQRWSPQQGSPWKTRKHGPPGYRMP